MRHTLLLGGVGLDVDNVADSVGPHELRELNLAGLLEATLEHVARSRSVTERVRHGDGVSVKLAVSLVSFASKSSR